MSIYKNKDTKKWEVNFSYKDSTGKNHRKHKRGFRTKKEAQEWQNNFLAKHEGSVNMLFNDFIDLYLKDKKVTWSPVTYTNNVSKLNKWVRPYFDGKMIIDIKPIDIRKWQNYIIENQLSPVYQKKLRSIVSAIFNYAVKYYDLKENPFNKVETMGAYKRDEITFWTVEEFNEFLKYVKNDHFKLAYKTLFLTGLRIGELTALRPCDFDFSKPSLKVNKNLQIVDGKELMLEPKTKKSKREVILPQDLADEIENFINRQYKLGDEDRVFFYNKKSYGNNLSKICKENNLKRIRLHDLRHSHASLLIELGFSPHLIAERLGHESVTITLEIYSHLYPNKQMEVAQSLNGIL